MTVLGCKEIHEVLNGML